MKLTINIAKSGKIQSAKTELQRGKQTQSATAKIVGKSAEVHQTGKDVVRLKFKNFPKVVTTAPDWSDILFLLRQYDFKKGGKQEFSGLWFHPTNKARVLTFSVKRLGKDTITFKKKKQTLGRYEVYLRSGRYLVWANNTGRVYKLMTPGRSQSGVVLEGYEKAVKGLK